MQTPSPTPELLAACYGAGLEVYEDGNTLCPDVDCKDCPLDGLSYCDFSDSPKFNYITKTDAKSRYPEYFI